MDETMDKVASDTDKAAVTKTASTADKATDNVTSMTDEVGPCRVHRGQEHGQGRVRRGRVRRDGDRVNDGRGHGQGRVHGGQGRDLFESTEDKTMDKVAPAADELKTVV